MQNLIFDYISGFGTLQKGEITVHRDACETIANSKRKILLLSLHEFLKKETLDILSILNL